MTRYEEKKTRLAELFRKQEEIEAQIKALLEPEKVASLPQGFSMSVAVMKLVSEAGTDGITAQDVLQAMQKQHPNAVDREKVASALAYLKNTKKSIEQTGRGVYRAILETENPAPLDAGVSLDGEATS